MSPREIEKWLNASAAEAEELVPALLARRDLRDELRMRPELRTPGVMRRLLAAAREHLHRLPWRACEITSMVARYARWMQVPAQYAFVVPMVQGEAWRDHAVALREMGRPAKAVHALRRARRCFDDLPASDAYRATVDLIEAPLLHDRGLHEDALRMVRRAARWFGLSRNLDSFVRARALECSMLLAAGDRNAAKGVWTATADAARRRGDVALVAHMAAKLGAYELRGGSAEAASELLAAGVKLFDASGSSAEAVRVRWHLAEAAAAQGRLRMAISEYHKVRAELLERGALTDAAIAASAVVDLYLLAGRERELPSLTATFVEVFRDAGVPMNAMEAFAYLRGRANAGRLTREDTSLVRSFFEELPRKPDKRFRAP